MLAEINANNTAPTTASGVRLVRLTMTSGGYDTRPESRDVVWVNPAFVVKVTRSYHVNSPNAQSDVHLADGTSLAVTDCPSDVAAKIGGYE